MFNLYEEIPIGIDLGTTNSCIGFWNGKEVKIIPNRIGDKTTPSILYYLNNKEEYLVGEQIQKYLSLDCQKIYSIKRIIGRDFDDKNLENDIKLLNYNIIKDKKTNGPLIPIIQNGKTKNLTPEYISSQILRKLVDDAEKMLNKPIRKVVITVPAYFDDAQRNSTIEAAKLAKLEVIRIINEPTAAALSYGLGQNFCPFIKESPSFSNLFKKNRELRKIAAMQKNSFCLIEENREKNENSFKINDHNAENEKGKNVMVFDIGGGTFDLAILQINIKEKEYKVKSKISNKYLGGDDFDNKIIDYCLNKFDLERNDPKITKKSMERLRNACEQAKKILSSREEAYIRVDNFINGEDIYTKITRKNFEDEICKDLFDQLTIPFDELLKGAELERKNIDEIILVGGSTKIPKIKEILKREGFDKCKIDDNINPDEVVAYGATIQAAMLMTIGTNNSLNGVKLLDITPISLGTDVINKSIDPKIKSLGNKMSIIIPKWTKIPIKLEKRYKTIKDNQETMLICVFEGENEYLKDNKLLGTFMLKNLPKRLKGEVECKITFEIDMNNILNVTAVETSKGISDKIEVLATNYKKPDRPSIGALTMSQMDEEKNKYDYDIQKYIDNYIKTNDINNKISILENYNQILENEINGINPNKNETGINENNIERYYFYVYQLFESYEEMLSLRMDYSMKLYKQKIILENIIKYINIFKKQNNYYIRQFIDLFSVIEINLFLQIYLEAIKNFNEMGEYYIENNQQFSRYYAKLYFEEVIKLRDNYKILEKEGLCDFKIMSNIKDEIKKAQIKLIDINSNAISLISESKNEKKLINIAPNRNFLINNSGFTFLKKRVNVPNKNLDYEEYNLILDELEKISSELQLLIDKSKNDKGLLNDLLEQRGICLGNIIKIKFLYLKGKNYLDYLNIIENCLFDAKRCGKNNSSVKWYEDALELKGKIEEAKFNDDKNSSYNIDKAFAELDDYFKLDNKLKFINYILEEWPYNGYNKATRPSFYDWDNLNRELIEFLSNKYHPDLYAKNTQEEIYKYKVMENIAQKLNNILKEMQLDTPGENNEMKFILK